MMLTSLLCAVIPFRALLLHLVVTTVMAGIPPPPPTRGLLPMMQVPGTSAIPTRTRIRITASTRTAKKQIPTS
ncbi:hypothetical protein V8F33_009284 [Rhypophila sp. PSN 637]